MGPGWHPSFGTKLAAELESARVLAGCPAESSLSQPASFSSPALGLDLSLCVWCTQRTTPQMPDSLILCWPTLLGYLTPTISKTRTMPGMAPWVLCSSAQLPSLDSLSGPPPPPPSDTASAWTSSYQTPNGRNVPKSQCNLPKPPHHLHLERLSGCLSGWTSPRKAGRKLGWSQANPTHSSLDRKWAY